MRAEALLRRHAVGMRGRNVYIMWSRRSAQQWKQRARDMRRESEVALSGIYEKMLLH